VSTSRTNNNDPPASLDQSTVSLILLALAAAILFLSPHFVALHLDPIPALEIGERGGACGRASFGPLLIEACR
jgi:hypothetical protein